MEKRVQVLMVWDGKYVIGKCAEIEGIDDVASLSKVIDDLCTALNRGGHKNFLHVHPKTMKPLTESEIDALKDL